MSKDNLGDRMKSYEDISRFHLTAKLPLIIRLDGKAFHTYSKDLQKPYDMTFMSVMNDVTKHLCNQVQNTVLGYTQSDEISLLLIDYKDVKTSSWFGSNIQKMVSVASGLASSKFTALSSRIFPETKEACFDARAFILPTHEINNYFIWRQQDWNRNSLSMLAQSLFSHKELQNVKRAEQHEMCFQKGHNWSDLSSHVKNGRVSVKRTTSKLINVQGAEQLVERSEWYIPDTTPTFSNDKDFIESIIK